MNFAEIEGDTFALKVVESVMGAHSPQTAHICTAILNGAFEQGLRDDISIMPQSFELRRILEAFAVMHHSTA